jgi:hypothetical protein
MKTFLTHFARRFANIAVLWVILIILHHISLDWMAESRSIEMIMTGGSPSEIGTVSYVLGFMLLRLSVIFVLPGFILGWLCFEMIDFVLEKRKLEKLLKNDDTSFNYR